MKLYPRILNLVLALLVPFQKTHIELTSPTPEDAGIPPRDFEPGATTL